LGQLYLNQGNWNGKQIVSASWVKESTKMRIRTGYVTDVIPYDYGYLWFAAHGKNQLKFFLASGFRGQYIFVMPENNW